MVDVEDANRTITGDQSAEVNDEVVRLQKWYGDPRRVFGYLNAVANADLWQNRPNIAFVTPSYSGQPGVWAPKAPPQWMKDIAFAQQFTDSAITKPWPNGTDLNYSSKSVEEIQALLGLKPGGTNTGGNMGVVEDAAGQLSGRYGNVRKPVDLAAAKKFLPKSFNPETDPDGPATNDMWAAIVNEVVWDGYSIPATMADLPDSLPRSLVALVQTIAARQVRLEAKVDRLLAKVGA